VINDQEQPILGLISHRLATTHLIHKRQTDRQQSCQGRFYNMTVARQKGTTQGDSTDTGWRSGWWCSRWL